MRNYLWFTLLVATVMATSCVKAKPVVSFGVSYHQPSYLGPGPGPYYDNYYGSPYQNGASFYYQNGPVPYRYPYSPGSRYGALDVGIGALSLTPFLL
ncbi:uncharacterized protein [Drosophila bipectinata]|uniref:uncharacterized protein n=1 Tax=Drosophila bipectinata TaxID=42026 RepID=UPI0038B2B68D